MARLNNPDQKAARPINIFSIISLVTGIFGWLAGIFVMLTGFPITPLPDYFHFGRSAYLFIVILPGISWLTAILAGIIGVRQITGKGPAKWGIGISGIGCALFYGLFLLAAIGFAIALRNW